MHTGDLAVMRADGYCSVVGRIKDMIIRGGENIYPREIEEFLYTHPDIEDAQVIGEEGDVEVDPEHARMMAEKAKLNAVTVDVEALKFEVEDMRRDHTYELEALSTECSVLF